MSDHDQGKKKIVLINTVLYGSTGNIVKQLKSLAGENGMEAYTVSAYARNNRMKYENNDLVIGNYFDRYLHLWLSRVTGLSGTFSLFSTFKLTRLLKRIKPDVIHLHNLHNAYINLPILFRYIKKNNIKVIWTLHDCWAFTGRCPHFVMTGCERWKNGCGHCPYPGELYPVAKHDNTLKMLQIKKKSFSGVSDMTIVTPSEWLAGLVRQSFLSAYPVRVINNGIDLSVFKPLEGGLYKELKAEGKYIVLGVALDWNTRKGIDVFKWLSKELGDSYRIVLVGTDETLEKELSSYGIKCIKRTSSQSELAEIYSAADVFVNPTREDTFPTVNIEALACGTPVITFNTGGSPECLDDSCGLIVQRDDIESLRYAIETICFQSQHYHIDCINKASKYDVYDKFNEYIKMYKE